MVGTTNTLHTAEHFNLILNTVAKYRRMSIWVEYTSWVKCAAGNFFNTRAAIDFRTCIKVQVNHEHIFYLKIKAHIVYAIDV